MLKIIVTASISSFIFGFFGVDWKSVDEKIETEFPDVVFISTEQLNRQYKDGGSSLPLIIDVREIEEYGVSHLQDALNLQTVESISLRYPDRNEEIIVYCSVGYRSAKVASQLQNLGYNNVRNLSHSIFEWANKGYPLLNEEGGTEKAHPFNTAWGALLDDPLHSYSQP